MSQDETIKALLVSYERTAQKLSDGIKVGDDELMRFMGLTGILSVQMQRRLWTQEELKLQIEACQDKRCESCPNSKALSVLMSERVAKPAACAPDAPQNVKAMLLTALAQNMRAAIITLGVVVVILGLAITFTRQIPETAGAVTTTTQALRDGRD